MLRVTPGGSAPTARPSTMYDDDHNPAHLQHLEIIVTWIFGLSMVALVLVIVSVAT